MARSVALAYALATSLAVHAAVFSIPLGRGGAVGASAYTALNVSFAASVAPPGSVREPTLAPAAPETVSLAAGATVSVLPSEGIVRRMEEGGAFPLSLPTPPEPPAPIYFTLSELHQHPLPIGRILIEEEDRIYADSVTALAVFINAVGGVDRVHILKTDHPVQADEFAEHFRHARYVPGKIAGRAVSSELRVEVRSTSLMVRSVPLR